MLLDESLTYASTIRPSAFHLMEAYTGQKDRKSWGLPYTDMKFTDLSVGIFC